MSGARVCSNILFAKDGEVFDFDGLQAIVIGGAYSADKHLRLARGWSWFADEQSSAEYWPLLQNMTSALKASVEVNGYQPITLDELIRNNAVFKGEAG